MHVTPFYAALLVILFVFLSIRVINIRRSNKVSIGDAGNTQLLRAMRVHSNFAEYVPLSLIIVYFVEVLGASPVFVHALGICLVAGRLIHAYGVSQTKENLTFRISGMFLTFTTLLSASTFLLFTFAKTL
jgi:uncharacterized protein